MRLERVRRIDSTLQVWVWKLFCSQNGRCFSADKND